jgi:predicted ATPase
MIEKITFKNYKSFKDEQTLELRPITILIGKNNSGKSAVAKLPTLIEGSLSGEFSDPFSISNNGISLGGDFIDLFHGKVAVDKIKFGIEENKNILDVEIALGLSGNTSPSFVSWKLNNYLNLNYIGKIGWYFNDINSELYDCVFKGFHMENIAFVAKDGTETLPISDDKFSLKVNYIGPYRSEPKREGYKKPISKDINHVGITGENTYDILINDYNTDKREILEKVNLWYKDNFDDWQIHIDKNDKQAIYYFELYRDKPSIHVALTDVGQGISQILPLVTRAKMKDTKPVLITIEEPELHLHPAAHGNLAELFVESLADGNKKYLIETHSQNFVLRLRRLIAEGKYEYFNEENVIIYYTEYDDIEGCSYLQKITLDELGDVSYWPENVFNESLDEIFELRKAQKSKGNVS